MISILLVIHLLVTLMMIVLILLQRSEGGGLGIGGGGGMGAFASPRSTANILTKATMFCFALFVILSLTLAVLGSGKLNRSLIDQLGQATPAAAAPSVPAALDVPAVPVESAPVQPETQPVGDNPGTTSEPQSAPPASPPVPLSQ